MGTFFLPKWPLKWLGVSRLELHTLIQTKSEYPLGVYSIFQTRQNQWVETKFPELLQSIVSGAVVAHAELEVQGLS